MFSRDGGFICLFIEDNVVGSSDLGGGFGAGRRVRGECNWRNCGGNYWDLSWQIHTINIKEKYCFVLC